MTLSMLFMCSCNNHKYDVYYNLGTPEIYCWDDGGWKCVALPNTSITKTSEEINQLQQTLPCSLNKMKQILKTYDDSERDYAFVCVVSIPPKDEELTHDVQLIYDNIDTYEWLYDQLGLNFNYSSTD